MTKPIWTTDQIAAQLTRDRAAWDASTPIAYAFYQQPAAHLGQPPNFSAFTITQRHALGEIFELVADIVPLSFVNVPDNGGEPGLGNERIGFFNVNAQTVPFWGSASNYQSEPNGEQLGLISGADVVINRWRADAQGEWDPGDSNRRKLMHEALHTLGIAHPGDYNGDTALDYENEAEYQQDSVQYTVMSYWEASNTGAVHSFQGTLYHAATPLIHDVAALQALYGANLTTRTGDTVYGFNSTAGRSAYDIDVNPMPIFTIWDAGGIDTLDLSGFDLKSRIDLSEGGFTDAGGLTRNISIAFGVTIENAIAGSNWDILIGNAADNRLDGGANADRMEGRAGDDVYVADHVGDVAIELESDDGVDTVLASVSYGLGDWLENVELTGSEAIGASGNELANRLTGNAAANVLDGLGGADVMTGRGGNDTYYVDNVLDLAIEAAGGGTDEVRSSVSFTLGDDVENLISTSAAGKTLTGNFEVNRIVGSEGSDHIDGRYDADEMVGGRGDDFYRVDDLGDRIVELSGGGIDEIVLETTLYSLEVAPEVENLSADYLLPFSFTLIGSAFANILTGGHFGDLLDGRAGADRMVGNSGDDFYIVDDPGDVVVDVHGVDTVRSSVSYVLPAHPVSIGLQGDVEDLFLVGTAAIDGTGNGLDNNLWGNDSANRLYGLAGDDMIIGWRGADAMFGGAGDDFYVVDQSGDSVGEDPGGGTDTVQSAVNWILGANVENLTLVGNAAYATGNALANRLEGSDVANVLNGGAGADAMAGGLGDDIYVVENVLDTAFEQAGAGNDLVNSSVSFALGANVERLTLTGGAAVDGAGNALANILTGNAAANRLDGGAGADALAGGGGNDTYVVDQSGDTVTEAPGQGGDTVLSAVSWVLGANLENLTLTGGAAVDGTGNALANTLTGNAAANRLEGGGGNDIYVVNQAGDSVVEGAGGGTDTVASAVNWILGANLENLVLTGLVALYATGNALANQLTGNALANVLNGGAGADTMAGGLGDDIYVVDNVLDRAIEDGGAGNDLVSSSVGFTLGANVERLTLTGGAAVDGTGNALANILTGNAAANRLDGRAGADAMAGGAGNDTYVVDRSDDSVSEAAGGGTDTVTSAVNWILGANLENLTLTGAVALYATGNALANQLTGNGLANVLNGGAGADNMAGGLGDDTYIVDNVLDRAVESAGAGNDLVSSSVSFTLGADVERLTLTGGAAVDGTGNALANTLTGNAAANRLDGGLGGDAMAGGPGADTYLYHGVADSTAAARDSITGFASGDRIDLSLIDAVAGTAANEAFAFIGAAAFSHTAGELRAWQDGAGWLAAADVDGDAVADLMIGIATAGGHALTAADFAF